MITIAPITIAWICIFISFASFTYFVGGFLEWDKANKTIADLHNEIAYLYKELDDKAEELHACRSKRVTRSK